nr:hypothetical protein GW17_00043075 [Ipomoea trifida]
MLSSLSMATAETARTLKTASAWLKKSKGYDNNRFSTFSSQTPYVLAEMVAVFHDQVIRVAIVDSSLALDKLPHLVWIQTCSPNEYRLPKLEPRAVPWFNFEYPTGRIIMSSKCIFYTMNCEAQHRLSIKHTDRKGTESSIRGLDE